MDGIIVDDALGSLGLLQVLQAVDLDAEVRRHLRQAVGLRHELVLTSSGRMPRYCIELVLVINDASGIDLSRVGQTLRSVMAESSYLHHIGVHLLVCDPRSDPADQRASIDRALCWLLRATRALYADHSLQQVGLPVDCPVKAGSLLTELTMSQFRLASQRTWNIGTEHPLHLIQGINGTGKSSLVEALEISMTGQVDRLKGCEPSQYLRILKNNQTSQSDSCEIRIKFLEQSRSVAWYTGVLNDEGFRLRRVGTSSGGSSGKTGSSEWKQLWKSHLHASNGFRLAQGAADQIAKGTPAERAEFLLNAFFPDKHQERQLLSARKERLQRAAAQLWEILYPNESDAEGVGAATTNDSEGAFVSADQANSVRSELFNLKEGRFSRPVAEESKPVSLFPFRQKTFSDRVLSILLDDAKGFSKWLDHYAEHGSHVFDVQSLRADIKSLRAVSGTKGDSLVDRIGEQLSVLAKQANDRIEQLPRVIHILESLRGWRAAQHATHGTIVEYAEAINEWLDSYVRADTFRRATNLLELQESLASVSNSEGVGSLGFESLMIGDGYTKPERESQLDRLNNAASARHQFVQSFQTESIPETSEPTEKPSFSKHDLTLLDRWIQCTPPFSSAVRDALAQNKPQSVIDPFRSMGTTIGAGPDSGLDSLLANANIWLEEARQVVRMGIRPISQPSRALAELAELQTACDEYQASQEESISAFEDLMKDQAGLSKALNELLAVFTPARWAYSRLATHWNQHEKGSEFDFKIGEAGAAFIWNTAELNSLALAMFLLCAPRVENPLGMLVMDDPFQNMDELTVTTVARGIMRLLRLWKNQGDKPYLKQLRLTILLHAVDDVERFRQEGPCHVYILPWLSPSSTNGASESAEFETRDSFSGPTVATSSPTFPKLRVVVG